MLIIFCVFFILASLDSTCTEDVVSTPEWLSIGFEDVSYDEYMNGGLDAVARIQVDEQVCTGALISDREVITSASCMGYFVKKGYTYYNPITSIYFVHNESEMSTAIEGKTKFTNVSKLC